MAKSNPYQAKLFNIKHALFDLFRWSGAPFLLWYRVKKIYEDKEQPKHVKGGALVVSNHILYSDIMVLHSTFWYRRLFFVVMKELFSNKFNSWFYHNCGCIPVDREKPSLSFFRETVKRLQGGNLVAMFPEGHVSFSNDNPMAQFKSGAILLAHQANVPIIPVYREIRKNIFARQKVVIGKPIDLHEKYGPQLGMNEIERATKDLFEKEQELKAIYKRGN